jgi:hypothetical protein
MMRRPLLFSGMLLALGGCSGSPFAPDPHCESDCPLPPTLPPNVAILSPAPNAHLRRDDLILAVATDDRRIDRVEMYWQGYKLHPASIRVPPYVAEFGLYIGENLDVTPHDAALVVQVVAWDIEGNSDTAEVIARYDTTTS